CPMHIVRCISCDGYGWLEDEFTGETEDCDWCGGIGYVYRLQDGTDQKIPQSELQDAMISRELERLEKDRMQEMGYQGSAKKPWEQDIRRGTQGGINPYEDDNN
ncbi:MAG: hypothetical protein KC496_05610, partial [Anaerolineae bacterium]|nr:hypothetical protein [Anaerolineae bacterium]